MNIASLLTALRHETSARSYIDRMMVIDHSASMLKVRLYITTTLFIQIYRNDRFNTTNLVLMHNEQRIYAWDQLGDIWRRIRSAIHRRTISVSKAGIQSA
jgi:hypothetical protein